RPLGIARMIRRGEGATAAPITGKVGANHGEVAGEQGRHAAPHDVRLRKAMQEEDRRPGAGSAHKDRGLAGVDVAGFEIVEHPDRLLKMRTTNQGRSSYG